MAHAMATTLQEHLSVSEFAAITFRQAPEASYLLENAKEFFSKVLSETEMHRQSEHQRVNPSYIEQSRAATVYPFGNMLPKTVF